ncbi:MAG: hypothetical protein J6A60_02905 [Clostridia bacterium]|nr:hypothetical protein [Clostridia bacterium]
MNHKGRIKKALKPSQRESITEFSDRFGYELGYEEKEKRRHIVNAVLIAAGVLALIGTGYFITDLLIKITEQPYVPQAYIFNMENGIKWISSLIIHA